MTPQQMLKSGDVDLAVYTWGEAAAHKPNVVLVHGYPDSASVWKATAELLAQRYFVIAYDVRGAGRSTCPDHTAAYDLEHLVNDLATVTDALSPNKKVHLVSHDWGSIQSWEAVTTERMGHRIASYTSISGPSLDHAGYWVLQRLKSGSIEKYGQLARQAAHSWYIGLFHLPVIAPTIWKVSGEKMWRKVLEKVEGIKDVEANPTQSSDGQLGVKLYRANVLNRVLSPNERRTNTPVQLLFPKGDNFMIPEIWDDLPQWVPNLWRREVNAGHWIQVSHPQLVADSASEFIDFIEGAEESKALKRARLHHYHCGKTFSNQLIVVTGAGSGFGRETALLFAEQGANVVAVDINLEAAERTAELARLLNVDAHARKVDVSNAEQMEELANWVADEYGAPDIVVNNAGIGIAGSFFDTSLADWDKVLKVNLWGVIHGSRLFGQQMINEGKQGHIVNVASMAAYTPSKIVSAYATTKAAVRMLSDCLRAELADKNIHVSTICPGLSITNITQNTRFVGISDAEQADKRDKTTRLYQRRNLQPKEIAEAILDAVKNRSAEVPVGLESHASRLLSRFFPSISRRIARLDVAP